MRKAPCADCEDKGCGEYHSQCKRYIEWSNKRVVERENIYKMKAKNNILYSNKKSKNAAV